jgi:hypothetical protein
MSLPKLNPVEPPWYGPVCPVVGEGWHREVSPYPNQRTLCYTKRGPGGGPHAGVQIHLSGVGVSAERRNVPAVVEGSAPVKAAALRSTLAVPAVIAITRSEEEGLIGFDCPPVTRLSRGEALCDRDEQIFVGTGALDRRISGLIGRRLGGLGKVPSFDPQPVFFVPVLDRQFGMAVEAVVIGADLRFDPARFVAQQQMHARRRFG